MIWRQIQCQPRGQRICRSLPRGQEEATVFDENFVVIMKFGVVTPWWSPSQENKCMNVGNLYVGKAICGTDRHGVGAVGLVQCLWTRTTF